MSVNVTAFFKKAPEGFLPEPQHHAVQNVSKFQPKAGATPPRGKLIPYDLALEAMDKYVEVMSDHGFKMSSTAVGLPFDCTNVRTARMTTSEEFNYAEVDAFLEAAAREFKDAGATGDIYTRLRMGIYTEDVLNYPGLALTAEEKAERLGRITIFIVPFVLPDPAELSLLNRMDTTIVSTKSYIGAAQYVYDFGGLQP